MYINVCFRDLLVEFLCIQAVIIFESDGDDFDFRVIY